MVSLGWPFFCLNVNQPINLPLQLIEKITYSTLGVLTKAHLVMQNWLDLQPHLKSCTSCVTNTLTA